jgi:peptidoglycan/LPS O-acetylase OafA/YrhL
MQPRRSDGSGSQAPRAVAALPGVADHAVAQWTAPIPGYGPGRFWPNGSGELDVFCDIVGLVVTISMQRNAGRTDSARTFAKDRIIRIVPLCLICTTPEDAAVPAVPSLATRTSGVGRFYTLPPFYNGPMPPVLPAAGNATDLTHGLVVPAVFIVCARSIAFDPAGTAAVVIVSLFVSAIVVQLTYYDVEQPLLIRLRTGRPVSTLPAPG